MIRARPMTDTGLWIGTVNVLDDRDDDDGRLDTDDLRNLIDMNARSGLPLVFDDEESATVLRRG